MLIWDYKLVKQALNTICMEVKKKNDKFLRECFQTLNMCAFRMYDLHRGYWWVVTIARTRLKVYIIYLVLNDFHPLLNLKDHLPDEGRPISKSVASIPQ